MSLCEGLFESLSLCEGLFESLRVCERVCESGFMKFSHNLAGISLKAQEFL